AEGMVAAEQAQHVLVVATEKLTTIMDWSDRTTAVLFGDRAGATNVRRSPRDRGILSRYLNCEGTPAELLYPTGGRPGPPPAARCGRRQPGMKVMFCAFGAGFTWASMVVQW